MSAGTIYGMISGLGKAFGDSYEGARKAAQEDEAPDLLANAATVFGAQPAAPAAGTFGALGQRPSAAPSTPSFLTTDGPMGEYLATTRAKESGGNDLAANPNSSAKGRYQFTDSTWAGVAKRHPDLGLQPGGWHDPEQQERAMSAFTADNAKALSAAGVPVNPGNLYVSHFLGEAGGPKFIAGAMSNPDAPAVQFVSPGAARANRSIFFEKDGRPKTAGAVYAERTSRFVGPSAVPSLPASDAAGPGGLPSMAGLPAPTLRNARPVAVANNEAETQALEQRMGMMPAEGGQPAPQPTPQPGMAAEADMPAQGAQPAGFFVPGQPAAAPSAPAAPTIAPAAPISFAGVGSRASRNSPEQMAALQAMWRNPTTRPLAQQIYGTILSGKDASYGMVDLGGGRKGLLDSKTGAITAIPGTGETFGTERDADGNLFSVNQLTGQKSLLKGAEKDRGAQITAEVRAREAEILGRGLDPNEEGNRRYILNGALPEEKTDKNEGARITSQIEARRAAAPGLGFVEGTPAFQSFVGTGKVGRDQDLSATDKKAILEADDSVLAIESTLASLSRARDLSKEAYSGPMASTRGYLGSMVGLDRANATQELDNTITAQALDSLKATFGSAPTEGERKILLDIQGASNQAPAVREAIYARAEKALQKRLAFEQARADDLRGGTFYKKDGAQGGAKATAPRNGLPVRVTPTMTPADIAKRYPSGTRLILPDGTEGVVP